MTATVPYIRFKTSNNSFDKYFRVISGGYGETIVKAGSEDNTIDGGIDVCQGGVRTIFMHTLRVLESGDAAGYGLLADLKYLFKLNNPLAVPSSTLTLIDHFSVSHTGYFLKQLQINPVTTIISGQYAWFIIQIYFSEKVGA